jgi:hypothetical protein
MAQHLRFFDGADRHVRALNRAAGFDAPAADTTAFDRRHLSGLAQRELARATVSLV